ncbi:MAG: RsmE family RNA methyltransferase [Niabella sp.]
MQLPFFYINHYNPALKSFVLDEDNSRHIVQVLRMQDGEQLHLTDGRGYLLIAEISNAHKKHCGVTVINEAFFSKTEPLVTIAISPLKNNSRFEWFLEKATEIGVSAIVPLLCTRTEKQKLRAIRLQNILVSAMLQSRQCWLPVLEEPTTINKFLASDLFSTTTEKYIAHCAEGQKLSFSAAKASALILIGPEGDFTEEEITAALTAGCQPVTLGDTRLRTESAGIVAAVKLKIP